MYATDILGLMLGPMKATGAWWAEGSSIEKRPALVGPPDDREIWDRCFPLNRMLLTVMAGTLGLGIFIVSILGHRFDALTCGGVISCSMLSAVLCFLFFTRGRIRAALREQHRFEQLRYNRRVSSLYFALPASVYALLWLGYVAARA
jgi:hypothetical protein